MSDRVTAAIVALSDAFRRRDVGAALACFADDPTITYAGSEQGELAVGAKAVRGLFEHVFARDEAYSWSADHVTSSVRGDLRLVMAELTGTVHFDGGMTEDFPYMVSGVLSVDDGVGRWILFHGAETSDSLKKADCAADGAL